MFEVSQQHHRRSIRLQAYDYTQNGAYFVTLCTHQREYLFGEVIDGVMVLNEFGRIAEEEWLKTGALRPYVELDAYVVMPNHFHGILYIIRDDTPTQKSVASGDDVGNGDVGAQPAAPLQIPIVKSEIPQVVAGSLGAIVRSFKSAGTKRINEQRETPNAPVWQRNYYEQVIRHEPMLNEIREYIVFNPGRWAEDRENLANVSRN